jgi:serine phosphatase RsbU (regulator of sigma subunit)
VFSILLVFQSLGFTQKSNPDLLLKTANELVYENPQRAIQLVKPIFLSGNENQVFDACYVTADCYYILGDLENSLKYYDKCLLLAEAQEDEVKLGQAYLGLGTTYSDMGESDRGFDYLFKSLDIREKLGDNEAISDVLNNIAVQFSQAGNYKKALSYMHQVAEIDLARQDSSALGISYSNLGAFHYFDENNDSALYYHRLSLEIRTRLGEDSQRSRSLNNIANVLIDMKKIDQAIKFYEAAIEIKRDLKNAHELSFVLNNLGESLTRLGRFRESFPYLKEANTILDSLNDRENLLGNSLSLAHVYGALGDYKSAFIMLDSTFLLQKEIFELNKTRQSQELMTKFETERTEKENEELRAKRAEDSLVLEKSKNRIYILIGGLLLLVLIVGMIFTKLRSNKKNTVFLKNLYNQLEVKNTSILDSINYAKRIQNAIMPPLSLIQDTFPRSFIFYLPKDVVAGDFYWLEIQKDKTLFAVADCTGHGVPGAMVSVVCNNALNRSVREHKLTDPSEILDNTRKIVVEEFQKSEDNVKDGMDIALCAIEQNELKFAGAHNPVWIVRKGAFDMKESDQMKLMVQDDYSLLEIKGDKQPIGMFEANKPFTTHSVSLQKEDAVYLFSDGYMDQFGGEKGKKFKSVNFKKLIMKAQGHDMPNQKEFIQKIFNEWKGDLEQLDDVCVIGLKI